MHDAGAAPSWSDLDFSRRGYSSPFPQSLVGISGREDNNDSYYMRVLLGCNFASTCTTIERSLLEDAPPPLAGPCP
jgi:hypothetical protein